jgi:MarR family transcriptional regulator for hemolysin
MPPAPRPTLPLGLQLARTARAVTGAFDQAMAERGASAAAWQVLVLLRARAWGTQTELAEAMGIRAATLTHHLNALERDGLVRRRRDDANRRVQRVELTEDGRATFDRLRHAAQAHDRRVAATLTKDEAAQLSALLDKVRAGFDR